MQAQKTSDAGLIEAETSGASTQYKIQGNKNGAADEPRRRFKYWEDTCQRTEGFGETAEEQNRQHAGWHELSVYLSALALSEHELQFALASRRRPPSSPEPACLGRWSIHLDPGRPV